MAALPDGFPRLGDWVWQGVTVKPEAKDMFHRALRWMFDYNHEEAVSCFEEVIKIDAECPLAYWGVSYGTGPNYNKPWLFLDDAAVEKAHTQSKEAEKVAAKHGKEIEKELCRILRLRFPQAKKDTDDVMQSWIVAYADEMTKLAKAHGEDIDLLSLAAEANMGVTPWKLWDLKTGQPAPSPARTNQVVTFLEKAMDLVKERGLPEHTGLLHLYIHTIEMSPHPDKALGAYQKLTSGICPDAAHLVHMGTHVGIQCGEYSAAIRDNKLAAEADLVYFKQKGTTAMFRTFYLMHNFHFMVYGAMFAGDYEAALWASNGIRETMDQELLKIFAWFGDTFCAVKYHVMVRFGKWKEILEEKFPEDKELNCYQVATLHYARTLALVLGGQGAKGVPAAEKEMELFDDAVKRVPEGMGRILHNNTAQDLLKIHRVMMHGEVQFRKGEQEEALEKLRKAVELEDTLPYDEPWGVMQPTRHAYGALLLEAGRAREALKVFKEDLGLEKGLTRQAIHPDNIWAMLGVVDAANQLNEPVDGSLKTRLEVAQARADPSIKASCFCRLAVYGDTCCA